MSLADNPRGTMFGEALHPFGSRRPAWPSAETLGAMDPRVGAGLASAFARYEFERGRYQVSIVGTGEEYCAALAEFRGAVTRHDRTGFLAIVRGGDGWSTAEEEMRLLATAMRDGGLIDDARAIAAGEVLATPIAVVCPITGQNAVYDFVSIARRRTVASRRKTVDERAPSQPFSSVETSSEAFAFARFVNEQARREFGRPIHRMTHNRGAVDRLFRRSIADWQTATVAGTSAEGGVAGGRVRAVYIRDDRAGWLAAHGDRAASAPGTGAFRHETPVPYAAQLAAQWSANLFGGKLQG